MTRFSARCWTNCATCEFWDGPRVLNELMAAAEVDDQAQGTCTGRWRGSRRYALNSCTGWRKWGMLAPDRTGIASG